MSSYQNKLLRWVNNGTKQVSNSDMNDLREIDYQSSFALEERARVLIQMFKIETAIPLLEKAPLTQSQQLLLAECYFEVSRVDDAMYCVENLKLIMTSQPRSRVSEIMDLVDIYLMTSFYLRALILLRCASKLHKLESKPNDAVAAIEDCSYKCFCIIDTLVQHDYSMKTVVAEIGPKFVLGMLRDLRGVKQADDDKMKQCEARCLNNIGLCFRATKKYPRAVLYFKEGIRILKHRKQPKSSTYKILGDLQRNLGVVLHDYGNISGAETVYLRSLNSYGLAEKMEKEWKERFVRKTQTL